MARYQSGSLDLHTTDLNSGSLIKIGGVTSMSVRTGAETMSDESGNIYDEVRSLNKELPEAAIMFKSIASVLTYIGLAGYCISSDGTHLGAKLYGRVLNDCKSPPAAGTNIKYTI